MKTINEIIENLEVDRQTKFYLRDFARIVWAAATKAQMEQDGKDEGVDAKYAFNPVPFPEVK